MPHQATMAIMSDLSPKKYEIKIYEKLNRTNN